MPRLLFSSLPAPVQGMLMVLLAWMIWAVDPVIVRLLGPVPNLVLAGLSLTAGGLSALRPGWLAMRKRPPVPGSCWLLFLFYVVVCTGLADLCYIAAVKNLNPGLVSVTLRSQLALVVLAGFLVLQERFSRITGLGIVLILAGNLLNGWYRFQHSGDSGGERALLGWFLALGAMFCWGLGTVAGKLLLRRFAPVTLTGLRLTSAGVVLIVLSLFREGYAVYGQLTAWQWLLLITKGCLISALGYTLYFHGLQRVKVGVAAALEQLAPFFTFAYTWLIFRETISLLEFCFTGLILIGTFTAIGGEYYPKKLPGPGVPGCNLRKSG